MKDAPTQLKELRDLRDGWLDGEGYRYSERLLNRFIDAYCMFYPEDAPTPIFFPTPEKDVVRAEWRIGSRDISLDVDLASGFLSYYHCLDLDTEQSDEADLDLYLKEGWDLLLQKLDDGGAV